MTDLHGGLSLTAVNLGPLFLPLTCSYLHMAKPVIKKAAAQEAPVSDQPAAPTTPEEVQAANPQPPIPPPAPTVTVNDGTVTDVSPDTVTVVPAPPAPVAPPPAPEVVGDPKDTDRVFRTIKHVRHLKPNREGTLKKLRLDPEDLAYLIQVGALVEVHND